MDLIHLQRSLFTRQKLRKVQGLSLKHFSRHCPGELVDPVWTYVKLRCTGSMISMQCGAIDDVYCANVDFFELLKH